MGNPVLLRTWLLVVATLWAVGALAGEAPGRIEGRVTLADGTPLAAVTVRIGGTNVTAVTDERGHFSFSGVPSGTYELGFSYADFSVVRPDVVVNDGATANVEQTVDWAVVFDTLTVYGVSKQRERIVEAPAAVTVVTQEAIARQAAHGQVPKLVEFTPGAEITQSGLYDFNLNTRGFNNNLNRRVTILIDGRQLARPNILAPNWADISFPLDDLAQVEFVRGPSGALYGVNSSSGVLNMTTRPPRYSQGGSVRLTVGELATTNFDFRWAGALGRDWYLKATGGIRHSGDFSVSRVSSVEYSVPCSGLAATDCIPLEAVPLDPQGDDEIEFGSLRVDKYWGHNKVLTLEVGTTHQEGPVSVAFLGRGQFLGQDAPWVRANFTSEHWNFLGYYNEYSGPVLNLGAGTILSDKPQHQLQFEAQGNWSWLDERVRLVGGAMYSELRLDPGRLFRPAGEDRRAVFAQADWAVGKRLKLVAAGRIDDSNLFKAHFSPRAAVVYSLTPLHTIRLTYGKAFEEPTMREFFVRIAVTPPQDLSAFQTAFCDPSGVDCGFGTAQNPVPTEVLAFGNEDLSLQETETFELGYNGILGKRAHFTVDVYKGRNENFVSSLLPQLGTPLGRINENFGPWEPPSGLPDSSRDAIRQAVPLLSNGLDGSPVIAALSYTNFGNVDTLGAELGVKYYPDNHWALSMAYAWFDYELEDQVAETEDLLLPNTPENAVSLGATYVADRWDVGLSGRWVDGFRWSSGVFVGDVESYTVVDLHANYSLGEHWRLGLNVANLLDNSHYEKFGGDLLRRRALASVLYHW